MATLKDIKLRMGSIENTKQITKAMKMVSASKMRRAEENIVQARPYSDKLRSVISNLSNGISQDAHPLLQKREGGKAMVLVISTDRGLCGGLNVNLFKKLYAFMEEKSAGFESADLISFGKKANEYYSKRKANIVESYKGLREQEMSDILVSEVRKLIDRYTDGEFNYLYLAYNQFKNVVSQIPTIKQVLPIEPPEQDGEAEDSKTEFIFEPSATGILESILPQYVENQAFTALLDNFASEHAARMTAMDSATNNATEMLASLEIQYNRARQAAITNELIEIISGAEAV